MADAASLAASVKRSVDAGDGHGLITRVAARLFTEDFQSVVDKFIDNNVAAFADLTDDDIASGSNKLEWYSVYEKFVGLFDETLEALVAEEGGDIEQFYAHCEAIAKAPPAAPGFDNSAREFVDLLRASADYAAFLSLMKEEYEDAKE